MEIRNYTVYNTEDIRAIYTLVKQTAEAGAKGQKRLALRQVPDALVVVYWQGRRYQPQLNVRPDLNFDPEREAHALRIKKPERLDISPIEMLANAGSAPTLPCGVVAEIAGALSAPFYWQPPQFPFLPAVHIEPGPELSETEAERRARVEQKKVRKALSKAMSQGLRMGASLTQAEGKVEALEAVEHLLDAVEKELLQAVRDQAAAMKRVQEASVTLKTHRRDHAV